MLAIKKKAKPFCGGDDEEESLRREKGGEQLGRIRQGRRGEIK